MISFLANPLRFRKFAKFATPAFGCLALILIFTGVYFALWKSPEDYQQGHSVRIMYVHVPAAWNSMLAYGVMALASFVAYIWRHPLADELARACALPGAAFTVLALITGGLWGKTSWGAFWVWDGRTTSYLLLLFLYLGYMSVWNVIDDKKRAARIAGLVAMVGSVNLPIIKFSVTWWNSLHQNATLSLPDSPGLQPEMLTPLLLMVIGYSCFFAWLISSKILNLMTEVRSKRSVRKPASTIKMETL